MKYELGRLGPNRFEELVQALISKIFNVRAKIYGAGPDRQREAVIEDADELICGSVKAYGRTIVQAKFKSPDSKEDDWNWLRDNLKKELDGFSKKRENEPDFLPETWLFFTNVLLTPGAGGLKDKAEEYVEKNYAGLIPHIHVLGADEIYALLNANSDIASHYAEFITSGDVLTRVFEYLGTLKRMPRTFWRRILIAAVAMLLACAIGGGLYYYHSTFPITNSDKNKVSRLISYIVPNLTYVDISGSRYLAELDRALSYVEGKTTDSEYTLRSELTQYSNEIRRSCDSLTSLTAELRDDLMDSRIDVGNLEAFKPALAMVLNEYADSLDTVREYYLFNNVLRVEHRADYIRMLRDMAELESEMLFYELNEILLPITNQAALKDFKNRMLPELTFLYNKRLSLLNDLDEIQMKQDAVYKQEGQLLDRYGESLEREKQYIDPTLIDAEKEALIVLRELYGVDTANLEQRLDGLAEKRQRLQELMDELVDLYDKLEKARQEAYEKFKPQEGDEQSLLWGKGKRFLTIHMPQAAAECFKMYAEQGDEDDRFLGNIGLRFAENCTVLEVEGGVVVCFYEENLPHQAVKIGDVIYEVDGVRVGGYKEYSQAVAEDGIHSIKLIRFNATGYELLDSVIDKSLGRLAILGLNDDPSD